MLAPLAHPTSLQPTRSRQHMRPRAPVTFGPPHLSSARRHLSRTICWTYVLMMNGAEEVCHARIFMASTWRDQTPAEVLWPEDSFFTHKAYSRVPSVFDCVLLFCTEFP